MTRPLTLTYLSEVCHSEPLFKLRFHPRLPLLAALSPLRDEGWVWTWDDEHVLRRVARVGGGARVCPGLDDWMNRRMFCMDAAWHPTAPLLALLSPAREVELWHVGDAGARSAGRAFGAASAGDCVAFLAGGEALWSGERLEWLRQREARGGSVVESTGDPVATWSCDTCIASHPEGELVASFTSDQGATLVRFSRQLGTSAAPFETFDTTLILDVDGYGGLVFSPQGDRFAIMGNSYELLVQIHAFPSLLREAVLPLGSYDDARARLPRRWREHEWDTRERVGFSADGRSLLVGLFTGELVEVDPRGTSLPSVVTRVHDGPVAAIAIRAEDGLMATTDFEGQLRLFSMRHAPVDVAARALTRAFLATSRVVAASDDWDELALIDGVRVWDLDGISEDSLPDDAPTWARIAARMSELARKR